MKRRNFFTLLFAPIIAKFAPKEPVCAWCKGTGRRKYWHGDGKPQLEGPCDACSAEIGTGWINVVDYYAADDRHYQKVGNGPIKYVGKWSNRIYFTHFQNPEG